MSSTNSIKDPYSDASVSFETPPPTPGGGATNDPGSLLNVSVPADDIEIDFGAASASGGDAGIRMATNTHAHAVVGTPKTSISLGASPTEDLGAGITSAGLAFFTAGTITGTVCGDKNLVNINNINGIVLGVQEEMVIGADFDWHIGEHTETHLGDHMDTHFVSHLEGHAGIHLETHVGEHTETHAASHTETHAGIHTETHAGIHTETHVLIHQETHLGLHHEGHTLAHEDTHFSLHNENHLGPHNESKMGLRAATNATLKLTNRVTAIKTSLTRISDAATVLSKHGTHISNHDLWVWASTAVIAQ